MATENDLSTNEIREILNTNKDLIESNSWDEFFEKLEADDRCALAEVLLNAGIDFLSYMTSIPDKLFSGSDQIDEIIIPENIKTIGSDAFSYSSIRKLVLPHNIMFSPKGFIFYNSDIKEINLQDTNLRTIPHNSFYGCSNLTQAILPDTLEEIEYGCFSYCEALNRVVANNVKYIRNFAFSDCINLSEVILGDSLTLIESHAFNNCKQLNIKGVDLADRKVDILYGAFKGTPFGNIFKVYGNIFNADEK